MIPLVWATGALLVYAAISLAVGDVFPFSRYSMYAKLRGRVEGAVFAVRVGEARVPIGELEGFAGLDPEKVSPDGYPCSQQWVVFEAKRWIEHHRVDTPAADAVDIEIGFRILRLEAFTLHERWAPLTAGRARRRRG